jgi:hypothetical protein
VAEAAEAADTAFVSKRVVTESRGRSQSIFHFVHAPDPKKRCRRSALPAQSKTPPGFGENLRLIQIRRVARISLRSSGDALVAPSRALKLTARNCFLHHARFEHEIQTGLLRQ